MRRSDVIYCIEGLAYICGSADLSGKCEAKVACMRKLLWKEYEALLAAEIVPEREPEPEPVKDEPEVVTIPDELPAEPVKAEDDVLVRDRKECRKCKDLSKGNGGGEIFCQYILATGKQRGCKVRDCEHYKDGKHKKTFRHTCEICGKAFTDNAPRTKICPECKAKGETK